MDAVRISARSHTFSRKKVPPMVVYRQSEIDGALPAVVAQNAIPGTPVEADADAYE